MEPSDQALSVLVALIAVVLAYQEWRIRVLARDGRRLAAELQREREDRASDPQPPVIH